MKTTMTTYGIGGFDPSKPNNNIIEEYEVDLPELELTPEEKMIKMQTIIDQLLIDALEVNNA